jgi:hypothetical protein
VEEEMYAVLTDYRIPLVYDGTNKPPQLKGLVAAQFVVQPEELVTITLAGSSRAVIPAPAVTSDLVFMRLVSQSVIQVQAVEGQMEGLVMEEAKEEVQVAEQKAEEEAEAQQVEERLGARIFMKGTMKTLVLGKASLRARRNLK